MTVYLLPNPTKPEALRVLRQIAALLHQAGMEVLVDDCHQAQLPSLSFCQFAPADALWLRADVVVTIGGDGTILHAARKALRFQKPLMGVNIGRLGFLTILEADELDKLLRLASGEYIIEQRSMLAYTSRGCETPQYALNDVVFFKTKPEATITIDIQCDGTLVSSFRGDGMVFSTPTGSTAYSMSAGGPIVDARLCAILATQICAHVVHMPPMVFAADRTLKVVPRGPETEEILVSCDGIESFPLAPGEEAIITQGVQTIPLIQFDGTGQLQSIDKKLKGR